MQTLENKVKLSEDGKHYIINGQKCGFLTGFAKIHSHSLLK